MLNEKKKMNSLESLFQDHYINGLLRRHSFTFKVFLNYYANVDRVSFCMENTGDELDIKVATVQNKENFSSAIQPNHLKHFGVLTNGDMKK
jgi:hypothetical protein